MSTSYTLFTINCFLNLLGDFEDWSKSLLSGWHFSFLLPGFTLQKGREMAVLNWSQMKILLVKKG